MTTVCIPILKSSILVGSSNEGSVSIAVLEERWFFSSGTVIGGSEGSGLETKSSKILVGGPLEKKDTMNFLISNTCLGMN